MRTALAIVAVAMLALSAQADFPTREDFAVRVRGLGSFELTREGLTEKTRFSIAYPDRGVNKGGIQKDEHEAVAYATRVKLQKAGRTDELPPYTTYSNCVVTVACKNTSWSMTYYLYPIFHLSGGLYQHEAVLASMPLWQQIYKLGPDREYEFRFVPDAPNGCTLVYLDGSLATRLPGTNRVTAATYRSGSSFAVLAAAAEPVRQSGMEELPPIPHRANALLAAGARLSVATGPQVVAGVPITVWEPSQSVDQGQHRQTTTFRNLTWNPIYDERNPWSVGPEYMQWRVPGKAWRYAHVLCADIPQDGREPFVGTQLAKFGSGCSSGNVDFRRTSLAEAAGNPNVREVGTLTYLRGGQEVVTPLYLVRQPLEIAALGKRGEGATFLDFEFVGGGTASSYPRSSVQVFGCSLEPAPYSFKVSNDIRGNIFEGPGRKAAGFDLCPNADNASGRLAYEIYDPFFKQLKAGEMSFALGAEGAARHFEIDLSDFPVGWYGMDYVFYDAAGEVVTRHASSFTVLAPDDREAGYESPYACWPQLDGNHASNPNRAEQLEVMRKAGYRKSWHPPCESEAEGAAWKVTMSSVGLGHHNPGSPTATPEGLTNRLDAAVADYRAKFAAFPHCEVIQLLHEQGGKELCDELAGRREPVRGAYAGWCETWTGEKWRAYFCTEYCKRMRREFPGKRIMVGNGSSSSAMIANLVRNGFDLNLVDQLGIESKGFSSMPELCANLESPGMLWALRETARAFGYSNVTVNACNEYVFRPERTLSRTASRTTVMRVTDYTLRDYLLSLAHGCDIISTGHLEDCNDAYYETNWGAGGQCTFYPYSYPKRMYTALAVLTRVLDCPKYSRRLPTGENTAYALEFRRARKTQDYAYALWTPHYGATLALKFPSGAAVRRVAVFGDEAACVPDGAGEIAVEIGSTPCYLIASTPAESARVAAHAAPEVPHGAYVAKGVSAAAVKVNAKPGGSFANAYGIPEPHVGTFALRDVTDAELGRKALELKLQKTGTVPAVCWEETQLDFAEPLAVKLSEIGKLGLYVRGNGSFSMAQLVVRKAKDHSGYPLYLKLGPNGSYVAFDGWQLLTASVPQSSDLPSNFKGTDDVVVSGIVCGSARKALDPVEMADITADLRLGPLVAVSRADAAAGGDGGGHVHEWGEWLVNVAPTCADYGVRTRTCTAAGCSEPPESETDEMSPLGHDWAAWVLDVVPTAQADGRRCRTCRRCQKREEERVAWTECDRAYGEADTNAVTYVWKGGCVGDWASRTSWEPSSTPCYGVPSNALATAVFSADVAERITASGDGKFPTGMLVFRNGGELTLRGGEYEQREKTSAALFDASGVSVVADGASLTFASFNVGDVQNVRYVVRGGGKHANSKGRVRYGSGSSNVVFRAEGAGTVADFRTNTAQSPSIGGTDHRWEVADGATLANDGHQFIFSDNTRFSQVRPVLSIDNAYCETSSPFLFGTRTDAVSPRIEISGASPGFVGDSYGVSANRMFFGTNTLMTGSTTLAFRLPAAGWKTAPVRVKDRKKGCTTGIVLGRRAAFEIDATALGVPPAGVALTNALMNATRGIDVATSTVLTSASVTCAVGAAGRLALSADGKTLNLIVADVASLPDPGPTVILMVRSDGRGAR